VDPIRSNVGIAHDWFQGFHGSERVVASMLRLFEPTPDVYTFHAARDLLPAELAGAIRGEARVSRLPWFRQRGHAPGHWRMLLPYMPRYFASLRLNGYDAVISSSHACAVAVRPPKSAFHLCYCYTPMRYLWLPETDRDRVGGLTGRALDAMRGRLRAADLAASSRPNAYVAISSAVADRIRRFYGRESQVIHPPVAIEECRAEQGDPSAFLWVHRLVGYKHPLEVVEAFRGLPDLHLTMVGVGPLEDKMRQRLPSNVTLHGWLDRRRLLELYTRAGGFIHVGEEDFGITMVEALASGTPVLALDRGGAADIVEPGRNGLFVSDPADVATLREAVQRLARTSWDVAALRSSAAGFSEERFHERLGRLLRSHGIG
jgi:glycosyltransferase involved in cell wall biosynthesis